MIKKVVIGKREYLSVFGNDYDTPDGTGVRDYIHVVDLAKGHIAALKKLNDQNDRGYKIYNLGTGQVLNQILIKNNSFDLIKG